jgi:site-specific recombinase XerD
MAKICKSFIDKLERPESGQILYFDDSVKGFGVRVTKGAITYIAQGRVNGKVVRLSLGKHGVLTPVEALKEAKIQLALMAKGVDPNAVKSEKRSKSVTLAEVFQRYIESHNLKPTTIVIYQGAMRRCFSDWQNKPITTITKDMIEKRHKELSEAYGPRGKGEAHANQAMRCLRAVFNYAGSIYTDMHGHSVIVENPVKRLSQLKIWNRAVRRQTVIPAHQLSSWFNAVLTLDNQDMQDYITLILFTGLRRNEAAQLLWENIDLEAKALRIPPDNTKNSQEHRLPLTNVLVDLLSVRKEQNKENSPYVFSGPGKGGHLVESKWSVNKVGEACGIKFMLHDLRRTFLTAAECLDIPHYALKKLANHRSSTDVTAGYIVADVERLRDPMQRITDFLSEKINNPLLLKTNRFQTHLDRTDIASSQVKKDR